MHVPQIRGAITRDLITKYHYFHTSFQIWLIKSKLGRVEWREGEEKIAPLAGSFIQGYLKADGSGYYRRFPKDISAGYGFRNGREEEEKCYFLSRGSPEIMSYPQKISRKIRHKGK